MLFYFFVTDLAAATRLVEEVGHDVQHVGYPPHALGGEARTRDPDGNTILLGQNEPSPGQVEIPQQNQGQRFSLLREAAALAKHRAEQNKMCEVRGRTGTACDQPAELKLADGWGDTAWACLTHADEALLGAPGVFIANRDDAGLATYVPTRR